MIIARASIGWNTHGRIALCIASLCVCVFVCVCINGESIYIQNECVVSVVSYGRLLLLQHYETGTDGNP